MNALVGEWRKETDWECLLVGEKKNYSLEEKKKNLEGEKVHFFFRGEKPQFGQEREVRKKLRVEGVGGSGSNWGATAIEGWTSHRSIECG